MQAVPARKETAPLQHIVESLGDERALAIECGVGVETVRAWLSGERAPSAANQRRLNELALQLGTSQPFPAQATGVRRAHAPDAPPDASLLGGRLELRATEEEERLGFGVVEDPSGVCVVARELRRGLRAVKVRAPDGSIEYAICGEELRPIYAPARSLDELRARFF